MTDVQLLTSIRSRAATRIGNALCVKIVDQLIAEARNEILEEPVMIRFVQLCGIYHIKLDEFDKKQIALPRPKLCSKERLSRLHAVGFGVGNPPQG